MDEPGEHDPRFGRRQFLTTAAGVFGGVLGGFVSPGSVAADPGEERWSVSVPAAVDSSPTVVDGTVFVGGYTTMSAFDAADGSEQWQFPTRK